MRSWAPLLTVLTFTAACGSSDTGITTTVKGQLAADAEVKAYNIQVETRDRVVTLTGTADTERERARAVEIAQATDGVAEVVNNITVNLSTEQQAEPATGTTGEIAERTALPQAASPFAIVTLAGILSLAAGLALWRVGRRERP